MEKKQKKTLIWALIRLTACIAVHLLCFPVGTRLAPLRNMIWSTLGKKAGAIVFLLAAAAALGVAAHTLTKLVGLFGEKRNLPLHGNDLFFGLGMIYVGFFFLFSVSWYGLVFGLALLILGGLLCYRIFRESRAAKRVGQEGETIFAEIINITHCSETADGADSYTVFCQANDRVYRKKTSVPPDAGCIGMMVPVRISNIAPEAYDVDLEHIVSFAARPE